MDEIPVSTVIFANGRNRIRGTERMFAAHDDVAAWRNRNIERTELRISHFP
jgi:hypothetical protein